MKRKPMDWKGARGALFETLMRENTPLTIIWRYFPECSFRQIEYHANRLRIFKKIKRPKRLHGRQKFIPCIDKKRACEAAATDSYKAKEFDGWYFGDQNIQVNDRAGYVPKAIGHFV